MVSPKRSFIVICISLALLLGLSIDSFLGPTRHLEIPVKFVGEGENFRPALQATDTSPTPIQFGDSVDGEFGDGDGPFAYTFDGSTGNLVTITMVSSPDNDPPIDPALQLLGPDGRLMARNDDSFDSTFGLTNARIVRFPLPVDGTYTILAMRSSDVNGAFTLVLKGTKGTAVDKLEFGKAITGKVTDSAVKATYQLVGVQGDLITITTQASGGDLIPFVILLGPDGDQLATSDPKAKIKTVRITRFLLRDDGTYTVQVTRIGQDSGTTTGNFRLTVTLVAENTIMTYGDTVQGAINNDAFEVNYIFSATKGDLMTITMKRADGDLASSLTLFDPNGKKVASNDGATGNGLSDGDAQISRFRIPTTGNYIIVASRVDGETGTSSGTFSLELDLNKGTQ